MNGLPVNSCIVLGVEAEGANDRNGREPRPAGPPAPAAAVLPGRRRPAVRRLHARLPRRRQGPARQEPEPQRARDPLQPRQQPLPLHRLRQDRPGGAGGGEGTGGEVNCATSVHPSTQMRRSLPANVSEQELTMSEIQDLYLGKKQYSVLGQRPVRHDGADKVTGKAIYTADLHAAEHGPRQDRPQPARPRADQEDRRQRGAEDAGRAGGRDARRLSRPGGQVRHDGRSRGGEPGAPGGQLPGQRTRCSTRATPSRPSPRRTSTSPRKRPRRSRSSTKCCRASPGCSTR